MVTKISLQGRATFRNFAATVMEELPKEKVEQLDLRGVSGVEAVITTLKRAEGLPAGQNLVVTLAETPFQLYDLLQQRGLQIAYEPQAGGTVVGLIRRRSPGPQGV